MARDKCSRDVKSIQNKSNNFETRINESIAVKLVWTIENQIGTLFARCTNNYT